jgi:hypothetical protein
MRNNEVRGPGVQKSSSERDWGLSPFVVTKPKQNMLAYQIAPFVSIHNDINLI